MAENVGKQKSLKLNATMNALKVVCGLIFPLISFPYTSRILGPDGTGKVNFAASIVGYFVLLASIGIPLYGVREVAKTRDNPILLRELMQELLILHGGASLISFIGFCVCLICNQKMGGENVLFLITSVSIPLSMLMMDWYYQGIEEYSYITIRGLAMMSASLVALFVFVHNPGDYWISAAISVSATLGSSVLNFWNARRVVWGRRIHRWDFNRHIKPLTILYVLSIVTSLYLNMDTVMLGFMAEPRYVGYYSSSMKLTKMVIGVAISFGGVLLPRLAWYLKSGRAEEFGALLKKSISVTMFLSMPITLALAIMSREILLVFAGPKYLPAEVCILITAPVVLFIGLTHIFSLQILYPLGKERDVVISAALGAVAALIVNSLLIPRYAHFGAAYGTLAAEMVVLVVQYIQVRRCYTVQWPVMNLVKYFFATLVMGGGLLLMRVIVPQQFLHARVFAEVVAGCIIYFSALFLLKEGIVKEFFDTVSTKLSRAMM